MAPSCRPAHPSASGRALLGALAPWQRESGMPRRYPHHYEKGVTKKKVSKKVSGTFSVVSSKTRRRVLATDGRLPLTDPRRCYLPMASKWARKRANAKANRTAPIAAVAARSCNTEKVSGTFSVVSSWTRRRVLATDGRLPLTDPRRCYLPMAPKWARKRASARANRTAPIAAMAARSCNTASSPAPRNSMAVAKST